LLILIGSPIGGNLTRRIGTVSVVRIGLVSQATALIYIAFAMSPRTTFLGLLPGLVGYGIGGGFAMSQLTNVVLSEIPNNKSGVASGTNTTMRQVGSALGIAVIGTVVTTQTISHAASQISSSTLAAGTKHDAIARVHALGANYSPSPANSPNVARTLSDAVARSVAIASHDAVLFAATVVILGTVVSLLIPKLASEPDMTPAE
jgi:MFS family permease